ncbi:MAG TPA: NrsF family protein [Bryobacteraceae bacterium]|jgi:hypothetical protein|nr:NrsF family protein [Bryobacteraceae bacterium]
MNRREVTQGELDRLIDAQELPQLRADRLKQIESAVIADLRPVRPMASDGVYVGALAGIFIAICIVSCYLIAGRDGWEALSNLQRPVVFIPLLAIASLLAFSLVRQMRPAAKYVRTTALFGAGVFILLIASVVLIFHPMQETAFAHDSLVCFRAGMMFAIPTAILFGIVLWRGAALSPALTGATAGGLAGLAGLTVLEIHCPNMNVYHIVVAHLSVVVVCALAGFIFSSVTFSRRWSNH